MKQMRRSEADEEAHGGNDLARSAGKAEGILSSHFVLRWGVKVLILAHGVDTWQNAKKPFLKSKPRIFLRALCFPVPL